MEDVELEGFESLPVLADTRKIILQKEKTGSGIFQRRLWLFPLFPKRIKASMSSGFREL